MSLILLAALPFLGAVFPALLIRAEYDLVAKDAEAQGLYRALTASPGKRYVVLGDATHFMQFEKRREALFGEVQLFLES